MTDDICQDCGTIIPKARASNHSFLGRIECRQTHCLACAFLIYRRERTTCLRPYRMPHYRVQRDGSVSPEFAQRFAAERDRFIAIGEGDL